MTQRLELSANVDAVATWGHVSPAVSISADYEPGDRGRALDLLQGLVDAARRESAPDHGGTS